MQQVTLKKEALLEVLKKNKEKHIAEYQEAKKNWKVKAKARLGELLIELEEKEELPHPGLAKPISYEKDYTTAISMLEFSVDDTIELTQGEFRM